jgi:hypothetical protein
MSPQATRENDSALALGVLVLAIVGLTLGYAPWVLAALLLAALLVLVAGLASDRPGLLARRAAGVFILMLIPAGLQAYAFYPAFLRAYNPRHTILPLTHATAWHPAALAHYPALLATLTVTGAALISSLILTYRHIQQRRSAVPAHWPQVGDHSGQYPVTRRAPW